MNYSISSWSLHGLLSAGMPLVDLPAQAAAHCIHTVEICHFHLPSTDAVYLLQLKQALRDSQVELYSILIDAGDITAPDDDSRERDLATIRRWVEVASALGATGVRVDAGLQPPTLEIIERSAANLTALSSFAGKLSVKVFTENWHETSLQPRPLLEIIKRAGGIGLCADTGNAEGPDKYETLALLLPHATSIHFKARYDKDGRIDEEDLQRCMALIREAGCSGPLSLIYGDTENEWAGVDQLKDMLAVAL